MTKTGNSDTAEKIANVLVSRQRGLRREEVERDVSFQEAYEAVTKLRQLKPGIQGANTGKEVSSKY